MIHLSCALRQEAQPIIEHLLLHHCHTGLFNTYVDKQGLVSLTITGTGKVAAAAGVVHTSMLLNTAGCDIWLNIGIAGHARYPTGQAVLANKIVDQTTGKLWYPQLLFDTDIPATALVSLDNPSSSYMDDAMYDMEASGFYQMVSRTGTAELCHCLKIISDNQASRLEDLDEAAVSGLMSGNLRQVDSVIAGLDAIAQSLPRNQIQDEIYDAMNRQWRFTHAERVRLKSLLHRWRILSPHSLSVDSFSACAGGKQVLAVMEDRLDRMPIQFGPAQP